MEEAEGLAERFEEQRPRLRGVAYRMLCSLTEADDAVQGAWIRLSRSDTSHVDSLQAWLTTVLARRETDGSIRSLGRADDVIKTREGPVFTGELERSILEGCPTVAEVIAIGLAEGAVERPAAAVVLRTDATTPADEIEALLFPCIRRCG